MFAPLSFTSVNSIYFTILYAEHSVYNKTRYRMVRHSPSITWVALVLYSCRRSSWLMHCNSRVLADEPTLCKWDSIVFFRQPGKLHCAEAVLIRAVGSISK